jgi:large repetitive protein
MKPISFSSVITFVTAFLICSFTHAQTSGISSSAVWITDCTQDDYFNTSGSIAPPANVFTNNNFGVHTKNSGSLIFRGGELRSFKTPGVSNVCAAHLFYRIYPQSATPGAFNTIDLSSMEDCDISGNFPSGGSCVLGQQKWKMIADDGSSIPYAPVDLTTLSVGDYILEVYYDITGSSSSSSLCDETITLNNGGNNYKASFSIQSPSLASANPTTCNGSEGFITISGLKTGASYTVSYSDDGNPVGPVSSTANSSGNLVLNGLNAGIYADFTVDINGCSTNLNTGLILSNPVIIPKFNKITAFCAGTTAPNLPPKSLNGITGTWNPAVISNTASGNYTFTPDANQCGVPATISVTVTPRTTPIFAFGTSLSICAGQSVPALPSTSTNGITGTWSPAAVNNTTSATYTFTPSGSQCANGTSFAVIVNPNVTPGFSFGTSLTVCAGATVPVLPSTSNNGITGTWSPSTVDNQNSASYTFTPTSGQCATTANFNVTVNPVVTPTFAFGPSLSICAGAVVPTLPSSSSNGISGSWTPAVVDNQNSGTYTFTPSTGQCATTAAFNVTVNPNITPSFSFGTSISVCAGSSVPILPGTSANGITGTWGPSVVDNQNSATYTFTPSAGQCALFSSLSVTVNPVISPAFTFGSSISICAGAAVPLLPTTSSNGVTGTWNPSMVDNQNTATYSFTPSTGQCAISTSFTVNVSPNVTPAFTFGTSISICDGAIAPVLPSSSINGISGTWSPAIIDNQNSGSYTFTPDAGQCATFTSLSVTVNPIITPIFGFGTTIAICAGSSAPVLPATSANGITGTWNPSLIDNQNSNTYTFTPASGQCASGTSVAVTVNSTILPTFGFGTTLTICAGAAVPSLPTTSSNGVTGTWSPLSVDNQNSGTYTFTPSPGQCATATVFTVTVNPIVTPTFSFGTSASICAGATVPVLPNTSANGIAGTWNPAIVDNQNSGNYIFTPSIGQCAVSTSFTLTVNANVTPQFSFGTSLTFCAGSSVPSLPTLSSNGVTGTWSPSAIDNKGSAVYTFTPAAGQCATTTSLTVTVNQNTVPTFGFGPSLVICAGANVPTLPATSTDGITGTWSPSSVDNQASAVYIFTPDAVPGECLATTRFVVTVNQNVTPTFVFGTSVTMCAGSAAPLLPTTSSNGINGTWSPASINSQVSASYTFTPTAGQCVNSNVVLPVAVTPVGTVDFESDTSVTDGTVIPANTLSGTPSGVTFSWTNSNTAIGLSGSGSGNVPPFTALNKGASPAKATITVTPSYSGCAGASKSYIVTVIPLDKDLFVPNVFSPNGDGKNDILFAYSNYIEKLEMRIFNQWGQQVELITDLHKGWDGRYKGTPQPVGVYMYAVKATMTDGRIVQQKGSITLIR